MVRFFLRLIIPVNTFMSLVTPYIANAQPEEFMKQRSAAQKDYDQSEHNARLYGPLGSLRECSNKCVTV